MQWRRKGKSHTLHIVVALKRENTYSGWLSSVKTVALKRDNTQSRNTKGIIYFSSQNEALKTTVGLEG